MIIAATSVIFRAFSLVSESLYIMQFLLIKSSDLFSWSYLICLAFSLCFLGEWLQGCHGQEKKVWKMKTFPDQGKVRKIWFESGILEKKNWQKSGKTEGISKFSENWDGYGSLFNFQKHKFAELASFFCWMIVIFSESKCSVGRFGGWGQL